MKTILEMPEPKDKKDLQFVLVVLIYVSKYIKGFSYNT